jgi:MFS family permease
MTRDNKLIMFSLSLWGFGEGMWFFIRTLYLEQLGATPEQVGLALSVAALTVALAYLPGGLLADRFDRKHVLVAGWLCGVSAPLMMALAADWRQFMIGFSVYNLSAFVLPAINTYVSSAAGRAPLERILPIVYAGFSIGNIVGPQVSQALLPGIGVRGVLLLSSAMYGLSTLAVIFVRRQPAIRHALPAGSRLSRIGTLRPALPFFAVIFVIQFGMSAGMQFVPNYLERIGWQVAAVSGISSALPIGNSILTVIIGHFSAGKRRRGLLAAQALVFAAMASFAFGAPAWGGFAAAGYFLLSGYNAARQQALAQVSAYVGLEHRGAAFALTDMVGTLSLAASAMLGGVLFASGPAQPFYASLILIPIGMLLTLRMRGAPKASCVRSPQLETPGNVVEG